MIGLLLDTNVLSEFSHRGNPDPNVKNCLAAAEPALLFASVLTLAEIRRGIELLPQGRRRSDLMDWLENELLGFFGANLLPVTKEIAECWAVLSAEAQRRGAPLAVIDGLIAATALRHDLTLVTRNIKDFTNLGVRLLNPRES